MLNTLKLAKKLIRQAKKFRKYRLLAIIFMAKVILSILTIIVVSYLAFNAQATEAAYGLNPKIKQVKTTDNPTVYYFDHARGLKKAYVNAKAFLAYGNKWSEIKIISQAELNKWPDLRLVKSKNSNQVFYISNGQKALIESAQQFIDSGFKWPDIVTLAQADLDQYRNANFKVGGTSGANYDSQLLITLDPSSPKADFLVINTQDNLVAVFNLKADNQPVEIKKLALNLNGVFNPDIIREIYLTNESDVQYDVSSLANNRQAVFNFAGESIVLAPGETRKIKVYLNLNDTAADILNHTIQIAINQASNIEGAKAIGVFPVNGEIFKLFSAGNELGKITASEQSLEINNNEALIGSTEKIIGKFKLAEVSAKADMIVKELKFSNNGNAAAADLINFKLKNKAGQIISTVGPMTNDRELIFKIKDYKIKKGDNDVFTISADVVGGDNTTINLQLDKVKVLSSQGNYYLSANYTDLNEIITIKRKVIGVIAKELKANNNIFSQQAGVIIGIFEIRNNNQKISPERIIFSLEKSQTAPSLKETIYLADYYSGQIYGYFNGDKFNNGAVSVGLNGLNLAAKQNLTVALVTNIADRVDNGAYYKVIFNKFDYQADNSMRFSDTVNIPGMKLIVSQANLYLYPNNDLGDQTFIKGEKNIKIVSFILEAAAGGDAKITGLTFSQGKDSSGVISFDNGFSNLQFYIGSNRVKTIKNPYSGDLAVDGFNYFLRSGTRAEIKIYTDTEIDLKASSVQLAISNLAAVNANSLIPAVVNNLNVGSHQTTFGQAKAELSKVTEGFVAKGEDDNVIAGFKVKNSGDEDLRLKSITVNAADQQLTYSLGYSNLRIVDRELQRNAGYTVSRPVAGANKIDLGGYIVKAGQEATFDVHVKTDDSLADQNINIYFSDFSAQGKNSKVWAIVSGDPTNNYTFVIVREVKTAGNFIRPVAGAITYGFHDPSYPYRQTTGEHTGVDIAVAQGTPVKAAAAGTVLEAVNGTGDQASSLTIKHSETLTTRYVHLSRLDVKAGDQVKQGDIIGLSGGTPGTPGAGLYTNGAHLHFEVLLNGVAVDPESYL